MGKIMARYVPSTIRIYLAMSCWHNTMAQVVIPLSFNAVFHRLYKFQLYLVFYSASAGSDKNQVDYILIIIAVTLWLISLAFMIFKACARQEVGLQGFLSD
ncbi:hypothetical protein KC19_VG283300 [Ceratodon purpureus]|uniref:Uncharacterized protein n=1 Tax=Ceratodon purpureus TaxID=3225 RepID=A0A8T0HV78_CERPU|nr:hypothetical protein KC19_VG283300 [Ceratodon purpureus]